MCCVDALEMREYTKCFPPKQYFEAIPLFSVLTLNESMTITELHSSNCVIDVLLNFGK